MLDTTTRRPLRILFDGTWWLSGPISNREVQREIVLTWRAEFPEDSLALAVPRKGVAAARAELGSSIAVVGTRLRPHGVSAILELGLLAARHRPDITISHNFTPLIGRSAVFVHDFLFRSDPQWFTRKERAYFALMPATVRRAALVATSSASEAGRIVRTSAARSAVPIGLGLARGFQSAEATAPAGLDELDGFLLAVGRLNARKNLVTTIEAALDSGVLSPTFPLLVVGEASGLGVRLSPAAEAARADGSVRLLGRVSTEELRWLYESTALFVFLTLDEGFGMPTLEALAAGAPILASDIPVFREILGDQARLVDPLDRRAIAAAMRELVADPQPPADPAAVLERYTWESVVHRLRAAVLEVLP